MPQSALSAPGAQYYVECAVAGGKEVGVSLTGGRSPPRFVAPLMICRLPHCNPLAPAVPAPY
jgi:hypothetical protein